jgi:murein DD-endopeptidase MepM/ murein hydrolase activator NlpD
MTLRRAVAALVLACAAVAYGAGPAFAVPEKDSGRDEAQAALARQVHERELALTALFNAAERHSEVEGVRADRLAALGYTGNLPDLEYIRPIQSYDLSAGFGLTGPLWESMHTGLDFAAATGTDLVALADGTVTDVADAGAYGLRTIFTLEDGTDIWYCHQLASLVTEGQVLEIGEPIGLVGSTGNATGPHLHLEVRPSGGAPIDPAAWLAGHGMAP